MSHLSSTLPTKVEIGAERQYDFGTEIVPQDSGAEVRNNRWATGLRVYDVSFPMSARDNELYLAVTDLFEEAEGSLHSFNFRDWTDNVTFPVRFDGPLRSIGATPDHEHIIGVTLVEVRLPETSP